MDTDTPAFRLTKYYHNNTYCNILECRYRSNKITLKIKNIKADAAGFLS